MNWSFKYFSAAAIVNIEDRQLFNFKMKIENLKFLFFFEKFETAVRYYGTVNIVKNNKVTISGTVSMENQAQKVPASKIKIKHRIFSSTT